MSDAPFVPPPSTLGSFGTSHEVEAVIAAPVRVPAGKKKAPKKKKKAAGKLGVILLSLFIVATLGGGALMIHEGTKAVPQDAPLPAAPDNIAPADQKPVGVDGIEPVNVENADTGGGANGWFSPNYATAVTSMSVAQMEPMSVFVPEAKMYSLARPSDSFGQSKYAGLFSIAIPDNPHRSVWHSAGGAMAGINADGSAATEGTTFLGSHSGYAGLWGAYVHMAHLTGGETVWTKDAGGRLQRWQVNRVQYMPHTEFPQEYWQADGVRRIVMATCGGTFGADGIYNENVFVEAKPVNPDGTPEVVVPEVKATTAPSIAPTEVPATK